MYKEHKFDFRIYMLIASTDPLIVYYHDGFTRNSMVKYDRNSKDVYYNCLNFRKQIFSQIQPFQNNIFQMKNGLKKMILKMKPKLEAFK